MMGEEYARLLLHPASLKKNKKSFARNVLAATQRQNCCQNISHDTLRAAFVVENERGCCGRCLEGPRTQAAGPAPGFSLRENENFKYTNLENIQKEVLDAKKTFQKYKWPLIDVTRKSVEETAASIIKIHEIYSNNPK